MRWSDSFTHWKVVSPKKDAELCEATARGLPGGPKSLGLFWRVKSPEAECEFLPAILPKGDNGKVLITVKWAEEKSLIFSESCDLKFNFRESEAKSYVELLKQNYRGTEDEDELIHTERHNPTLAQRSRPYYVAAFWLGCLWLIWFILQR